MSNEARLKRNQMTKEELVLENQKLRAEISKLNAEARQIGMTTLLAPFLAAAAMMGGTAAIVKLFF
jgi:hypothetical protein